MGEKDRRLFLVQPRQVILEPLESSRLNLGLLVEEPLAGVQADELPAPMAEPVIQSQRKPSRVSFTVGLAQIIVVADHRIHRARQQSKEVLNRRKIARFRLVGEVTGVEAKLGLFSL